MPASQSHPCELSPDGILQHVQFIDREIALLRELLHPEDCGHLHTTIHTLSWHRDELLKLRRHVEFASLHGVVQDASVSGDLPGSL